jgi:hypothetical protein
MVFKIPYAGYIGRFVRTPKGFIAMIVFPGLLLIAGEIKNILNELSKEENEKKKQNADAAQNGGQSEGNMKL